MIKIQNPKSAVIYNENILKEKIPESQSGVYILGIVQNYRFIPRYVGRSDACLLKRLLTHNHRVKMTHLIWRVCSNAKEAFNYECTYFHEYEEDNFINNIHPASPKGLSLECPICSNIFTDIS